MKTRLPILLLTLAAALDAPAAAPAFGNARHYPNLGLILPRLADAKSEPLPLPLARPYIFGDETLLAYQDRFDPHELWYNHQCAARWRDPSGNRLILGRATRLLPRTPEEDLSREQFHDALEDPACLLDPKDRAHLAEWVADFTGLPLGDPEPRRINTFTLDDVLHYPSAQPGILVYAFRPRRVGNAKDHDWFCAILHAPADADPAALRETFEDAFIARLALPSRAETRGVTPENVAVLGRRDTPPDQPDHPVRVEARKSIENCDDWWYAETEGYIILSDTATDTGRDLIRDLQSQLPAWRRAYAALLPALTSESGIALIRLFHERDDYIRHVGEKQAWSGALWMPGRRELVLFLHPDREAMLRTFRHEAFHQYLSHAYCMIPAPPWLNEGHACLFESSRADAKGRVVIEEDPERAALLDDHLDTAAALIPALLQADYAQFYGGTPFERRLKYALAWGLAYYLQKGAPLERNKPYAALLPDLTAALAETQRYDDATAHAFSPHDIATFQSRFKTFWLKNRQAARQYDPLKP